jgi:hypothetical protein
MPASQRAALKRLNRRDWIAGTALLASSVLGSGTRAEPPAFRSVKDVRPRIPDELDRPVRRETSSHRGWEIREDQFTVAANTSEADAKWAAAAVQQARGQMFDLADRFTSVHRAADFGLNSLQVVIDGEPPRERDAPLTSVNVVGLQTQVQLNVSPGQPPLQEQLLRLRESAAFAVLHAAELDGVLPPWVVTGLASHVALIGQPDDSPKPDAFSPQGVPLGGEQWRFNRVTPDRLPSPPQNLSQSASQVAFLLTGDDAQFAPQFLASVKSAIEAGRTQATRAGAIQFRRGEERQALVSQPLDRLITGNREAYEAWLKDPFAGQPMFEPEPGISDELLADQREMLVVLKLWRRGAAAAPAGQSVKIATFDRELGKAIVGNPNQADPLSVTDLLARLRDPNQPAIATLDVDGSLLLSTDRERIEQLLGWDGQRYRATRDGERWVLVRQLPGGRTLQGRLADNAEKPSRPKAEFSVRQRPAKPAKPTVAARG